MAERGFSPEDKWATYVSSKYNATVAPTLLLMQLCFTHKKTVLLFLQKCITASYITDGEIMRVEGGSVTSGFATNMCQHEYQRATL